MDSKQDESTIEQTDRLWALAAHRPIKLVIQSSFDDNSMPVFDATLTWYTESVNGPTQESGTVGRIASESIADALESVLDEYELCR